ncbi:MAG: CdaR family protein [Defluviitaleaceae bacterium]|nr:CdaR family protein [Defluviitaleaceae bacterium]
MKKLQILLTKLKDNFLTNLPWKIVAFLMAFVLWFIVMNVEDPIRNEFITIPLELRNEDALLMGTEGGIHLENIAELRAQSVRFHVRGTSRTIGAIRQTLRAYIDLSTSDIMAAAQNGETLRINIEVEGGEGSAEIHGRTPSSVDLIMDIITSVILPVEIIPQGDVAEGFVLLTESIRIFNDNYVTVTGPSNVINRIDRLVVNVDVENANQTIYLENHAISALDIGDIPIFSQHLNVQTISAEIPIFSRGQVQIMQPLLGNAQSPEGFGIHNISWNPQTLDVAGNEDIIAELVPILLSHIPEEMVMHNTTDFIVIYDIREYLPSGVFLINPNHHTINVDIFVEPILQQDFVIPRENISIIGLPPNAEVLTNEVTIRLAALQSTIAGITSLTPTAFVGNVNLVSGLNEVLLVTALPPGVNLVGDMPTIMVYLDAQEEDEYDEYDDTIDAEDEEEDEEEEIEEDEEGD